MLENLLYQVLLVVIQVVIVAVGGFLVNYLRAKVGTEKLSKYYDMVKKIVMAVEQSLGPGNGADKKEEAVQLVKNVMGNRMTETQIETFIETAVFEMNMLLKKSGLD